MQRSIWHIWKCFVVVKVQCVTDNTWYMYYSHEPTFMVGVYGHFGCNSDL